MKKYLYIVPLLMLAFSGCQKTDVENPEIETIQSAFRGDLESILDTRTALDKNNNVRWSEGDQVIIFNGSTLGGKYQVTDDSVGETSAGFDYIEDTTGGFVSGSDIGHNVALYPFDSKVKCAKGDDKEPTESYELTKVKALSVQNYVENSFGPGTFPMVAVTSSVSDYRLSFKNVFGGMKLQLKGDCTVSSITVKGQASEPIAGTVSVTAFVDGSAPTVSMGADATDSVTLDCGEYGVELNEETATNFIIALPPTTFKSGFTVSIVDTEGRQMTIKTSKENKVYRSSLLKMPEITLEPSEVEVISFADSQVKEACVAAFDTDGDGEVSYEEAAAAESLTGVLDQYKTIKSFDEFQYFTSITSIPEGVFMDYTMLETITFPESLRTIEPYAFSDCTSLRKIHVTKNVTSIGGMAFYRCEALSSLTFDDEILSLSFETVNYYDMHMGPFDSCTSLEEVKIPAAMSYLESGAFAYCTSLKTVTFQEGSKLQSLSESKEPNVWGTFCGCFALEQIVLPDNVTSIGESAFRDCFALMSVTLGSALTSIGDSAFSGCSSLSSIVLPDNVTSIGSGAFESCTSLSSIVLPDKVTKIGAGAFSRCSNLSSITIPDDVTKIDDFIFSGCSSLSSIVLPDNVTSIGDSAFSGCSSLSSIVIPDNVISIGGYAFAFCPNLSSIVIPDKVDEIALCTFEKCI